LKAEQATNLADQRRHQADIERAKAEAKTTAQPAPKRKPAGEKQGV
jgi:hypothetical protein